MRQRAVERQRRLRFATGKAMRGIVRGVVLLQLLPLCFTSRSHQERADADQGSQSSGRHKTNPLDGGAGSAPRSVDGGVVPAVVGSEAALRRRHVGHPSGVSTVRPHFWDIWRGSPGATRAPAGGTLLARSALAENDRRASFRACVHREGWNRALRGIEYFEREKLAKF